MQNNPTQGLNLLYTGNGKGKTTAALGLLFRAWGNGLQVAGIQFIKSAEIVKGEMKACQKVGIPFEPLGKGFVFEKFDTSIHAEAAKAAWDHTQEVILHGNLDMLLLDEITYLFIYHWLDVNEFIDWVRKNKNPAMHLVMTGRSAPQELIDFADMVTELKEVKHHYSTQRIPAQIGIEY
jgi:cob(I)alamin adenosyltransferase